ncbi:MAG: type II toxin-antitoxin system RelE/ParE family toxin [Spirochaetaceae bacterium]
MESKLVIIHRSQSLDDLRVPPGNRLEALSGTRLGHDSIRIDQQWRDCFRTSGFPACMVGRREPGSGP